MNELTQEQKLVLNVIQDDFPIVERPFDFIDKRLNFQTGRTLKELKYLKQIGLIRQISPIYDTRKLGYKSTLVAFKIPENVLLDGVRVVNRHPGVSHNYERTDEYNVWFTIAVPSDVSLERTIEVLAQKSGAEKFLILPTLKLYKIGVKLDVAESDGMYEKNSKLKTQSSKIMGENELSQEDKEFIKITQETILIEEEPFKKYCEPLDMSFSALKRKFEELKKRNIMRRFAAILRHRKTGFSINAMVVWKIPDGVNPDDVAAILASYRAVSHCYKRPSFPDFPYSLYSMIHTKCAEECNNIVIDMVHKTGLKDYKILISTREFKKIRLIYFSDKTDKWNKENNI